MFCGAGVLDAPTLLSSLDIVSLSIVSKEINNPLDFSDENAARVSLSATFFEYPKFISAEITSFISLSNCSSLLTLIKMIFVYSRRI